MIMGIHLPGTCLSFVLGVEPSKKKAFSFQNKGSLRNKNISFMIYSWNVRRFLKKILD